MGEVNQIQVTIVPEYVRSPKEETFSNINIKVKVWGKPDYQVNETIPNDDFMPRFDWFMKRAVEIIRGEFTK